MKYMSPVEDVEYDEGDWEHDLCLVVDPYGDLLARHLPEHVLDVVPEEVVLVVLVVHVAAVAAAAAHADDGGAAVGLVRGFAVQAVLPATGAAKGLAVCIVEVELLDIFN